MLRVARNFVSQRDPDAKLPLAQHMFRVLYRVWTERTGMLEMFRSVSVGDAANVMAEQAAVNDMATINVPYAWSPMRNKYYADLCDIYNYRRDEFWRLGFLASVGLLCLDWVWWRPQHPLFSVCSVFLAISRPSIGIPYFVLRHLSCGAFLAERWVARAPGLMGGVVTFLSQACKGLSLGRGV